MVTSFGDETITIKSEFWLPPPGIEPVTLSLGDELPERQETYVLLDCKPIARVWTMNTVYLGFAFFTNLFMIYREAH